MGELNIPTAEIDALNAINADVLREHIDQCLRERRSFFDRTLRLDSCGAYVGSRLRAFDQALAAYANAKSAKKFAETEYDARKAGGDLEHAVQQMKARAATQQQEGQLFVVDDHVIPPFGFSEQLNVRVSYRWRADLETEWQYGTITFSHTHISRPDYLAPAPARKLSRSKQEQQRQEELSQQWEHLKSLGLHAVRDHFRRGGNGAMIPQAVKAKTDAYTQGLNNFSAAF